jgi:signal transduction histidine kinase
MHAVWLVLLQAQVIRATLVQTIPPHLRREGQSGAEEIELVQFDAGRLTIPSVETAKQSARREWTALRKMGGVAVLSHFMVANQYRDDHSYGLYRLTHSPTSRQQIEECLGRIAGDLEEIRDLLSGETFAAVQGFVARARVAFQTGWEHYVAFSAREREAVKQRLRFSFKAWVADQQRAVPELAEAVTWEEDARLFPELYCDADTVRRGLNAIVENAVKHGGPVAVRIRRNDERLEAVIEDRGVGFANLAERFQAPGGSAGGGLADVKRLTTWFRVRIEATTTVCYDLATKEQDFLRGPHTGTRYVLSCPLPATLPSRASERVP